MKKLNLKHQLHWNSVLLFSVLITAFIVPVIPQSWGNAPTRIAFTLIFLSGIYSLEKRKDFFLYVALAAFVLEWISQVMEFEIIAFASKATSAIFFIIVVITLIRQIAISKIVTAQVILQSISGYLLLWILFSIVIAVILQVDPAAYNIPYVHRVDNDLNRYASESMYYGFVTLGTLGYGDILPMKPYSRSLATLITISGQLYIAIIIALLVGKHAAAGSEQK